MSVPSRDEEDREDLRRRLLGLGERSLHKTYYPELQRRVRDLERFRSLLDHSADAIFLVELPDGAISDCNATACRLLRRSAESLVGTPWASLAPQEERSRLVAALQSGASGAAGEYVGSLVCAGGTLLPVEIDLAFHTVDGKLYCVAAARDVTKRRALEEQLLQAQKMEGIGRLAGGIAHDFNNLLTVIVGYGEMARKRCASGASIDECVAHMLDAAGRAAGLTRQLLTFARKQTAQPRVIDLNELVAAMLKMLQPAIGDDVLLRVEYCDTPARVRVDPGQIEQVLMNLAVNARDAMPGGGHLTIGVTTLSGYPSQAWPVRPLPASRYVTLFVRDTGVGMSEEVQARVFEPFYTTKRTGEGTGLGLAICYGVAQQAGGYIDVVSRPGEGATFRVHLPLVDEGVMDGPLPEEVPAPAAGTGTILLVEDDDLVRGVAIHALRAQGYTVIESSNGAEALEVSRRTERPIDLLITDVVMPEMGGKALAEALRTDRPDTRAVFTSGYGEVAAASEEDGVMFVAKPYAPSTLLAAVRRALTQSDPCRPRGSSAANSH